MLVPCAAGAQRCGENASGKHHDSIQQEAKTAPTRDQKKNQPSGQIIGLKAKRPEGQGSKKGEDKWDTPCRDTSWMKKGFWNKWTYGIFAVLVYLHGLGHPKGQRVSTGVTVVGSVPLLRNSNDGHREQRWSQTDSKTHLVTSAKVKQCCAQSGQTKQLKKETDSTQKLECKTGSTAKLQTESKTLKNNSNDLNKNSVFKMIIR